MHALPQRFAAGGFAEEEAEIEREILGVAWIGKEHEHGARSLAIEGRDEGGARGTAETVHRDRVAGSSGSVAADALGHPARDLGERATLRLPGSAFLGRRFHPTKHRGDGGVSPVR